LIEIAEEGYISFKRFECLEDQTDDIRDADDLPESMVFKINSDIKYLSKK